MRFAYLIMAHHKFPILKLLLEDLDDERNDIFLHIDKKAGRYNQEEIEGCIKRAKLILVKRYPVYWGHYSQIRCVFNLIKVSVEYGYHDYYHLMVGVEFPLKSQDYIYSFFERNEGYEFIGYDLADKDYIDRIKYWHIWGKYVRSAKRYQMFLYRQEENIIKIQKKIGINRIKENQDYFKKGYANWSITHELALYILAEFKHIKKKYRFTLCADEIFIHTLVYHSKFYERVFDYENEYNSVMRLTTWKEPHNRLTLSDYEWLITTDKLFGRKFDGEDAEELINKLKRRRA